MYQRHMFNFNLEATHSSQINKPTLEAGVINNIHMQSQAVMPT